MSSFRDSIYAVLNLSDKTEPERITRTKYGQKNALDVAMNGPKTAFGELHVAQSTPTVQIDALLGLLPSVHETFSSGTGSVVEVKDDHGGKEFHCQSGTDVGGYGLIRSKRTLRYRPGSGGRMRFTARFGTPAALSAQRAGGINVGTELSFGYEGTQFGLLYRTSGRLEIQTLTISAAASGNETATITLAGTAYTVNLTSGTAAHNAFEIASDSDFGVSQAWTASQSGNTVIFVANSVGPKTGTMSFASTGTATGSLTETANGVDVVDTFVNQEDWNINTLTKTNDGGFILDPSKGNVFEIVFQYLGYGAITYRVANPETGEFIDVHRIKYSNANERPNLETPLFKIGWFAASLGTTTNTEIFGASAYASTDGYFEPIKNPAAHSNTKTGVGTTATNIVSIKVRPTFNGYVNLHEVLPKLVSVAVEGTKTAVAEIHLNPTLGGEPNWTPHDSAASVVDYDTSATTVSGGQEIAVIGLGKTGNVQVDLSKFNLRIQRNDVVTVAVKASSGTTEATAGITWVED